MIRSQQAKAGGAASLGQRAPRLMFRVALFSALTLGIGAATLLVFIRHFERSRAEQTATLHASVMAQAVVDRLRPDDLEGSVSLERRDELDRLFEARVLDDETLASAVAAPDGRFVYATDRDDANSVISSRELLGQALAGTVASELVTTDVNGKSTKVFRAYAPFRLADGSSGVLVVDKDYGPIAAAARRAAITVAAVLELVLLSLWLCLFPIMRSVTRRMNRQLDTIAHQALHDDLTGLANRTQFGHRLDEALESEGDMHKHLAVFFIDLERFKEVNDALGHDCGNELLTSCVPSRSGRGRERDRCSPRRRRVRCPQRARRRREQRACTRRAAADCDRAAVRDRGRLARGAGEHRYRHRPGARDDEGRALAAGRHRHVRGQAPWRTTDLLAGVGRQLAASSRDDRGVAPRDRGRRARRPVPAAGRSSRGHRARRRGARTLEASDPWVPRPRSVPGCRRAGRAHAKPDALCPRRVPPPASDVAERRHGGRPRGQRLRSGSC